MSLIEIKNLKYRYPGMKDLVLDDISLSIERGEFIGIVGRNGSGKSTLSQAIIGLVPLFHKGAYGGQVVLNIDGQELLAGKIPVSDICEHVGLVFQNPFNQLSGAKDTVYDEVAFGLQNLSIEREEMIRRVDKVLKQLDIYQYKDRNPFNLSGGQMQRVAIASVLVMKPEIIILDEPTSQLDPQGTEEVFKVVDELRNEGITIIMIEQKLERIADFSDRVILMNNGKVAAFGTPAEVFSRDDLEEMGVNPPLYTKICKQNGIKDENGYYPSTFESAKKYMKGKKTDINVEDYCDLMVASEDEKKVIFDVKNMSFSYDPEVPVITGLDLSFVNRATAIIGQNGAGKTTLVRLLKGLLKPVSGNIYFGSDDIGQKTVAMLASKIGYVFQNPDDQIFKYNVMDEVMFGALNIGMDKAKAKEEAIKALTLTDMLEFKDANPYDLDLHQRKMVAISSVIAMDTDVVILDEPTIAQDYPGRNRLSGLIRNLDKEGKLVIAILHDMDFVLENFERVIVMAHGAVLADGTGLQVYKQEEVLEKARIQKPYVLQMKDALKE